MPKRADVSPKDAGNMPTAETARELLIAAAGPRDLDAPSVKAMLSRAALRLGIGLRRARAIYHREARLIGADEWQAIMRRAAELNIKNEWERSENAAVALRLSQAVVESVDGAAIARPPGDPAGEEDGRPGAGATNRPDR